MVIKKLSSDCRAILSKTPLTPAKVHRHLREYLMAQWHRSGYCVHDLKAVETPSQFQESCEVYSGLGQLGPVICQNHHGHRKFKDTTRLLLHWPTLLRQAPDLVFQKPALALFLLGFEDVIGLKSPFVLEALTRHYRLVMQTVLNESRVKPYTLTEEDMDLPTVFASEVAALQLHLNALAEDTSFIRTLQQVYSETYNGVPASEALKRFARNFRGVSPDHRRDCSMLVVSDIPPNNASFAVPVPQRPADPQDFACGNLNWILNELWVAYRLSQYLGGPEQSRDSWVRDIVKPFGVFSGQKYLVINWELWVGYRNKLKLKSTYLDYVYPRNTAKASSRRTVRHKTLLLLIAQRLWLDYPSITVSPLNISESFRNNFDKLWGPEWAYGDQSTGMTNSTIIDLELLRRISHLRYKQSIGRGSLKSIGSIVKRKVTYEPLYYFFTISTVDPKTMHNLSLDCTAIHVGRKVYFQPSWELPDSNIYVRPNCALGDSRFVSSAGMASITTHTLDSDEGSAATYSLRPGVIRVAPSNRLAYSADVLLDPDFSAEALRTSEMVTEIHRISGFKRKYFTKLRAIVEDTAEDSAPRRYKSTWSFEEDLFIKMSYRPNMSEDDKAKLEEVCSTRNPRAISLRATFLRRELIAKGVYDLNELPHKVYNHKIALEITAAKKAAEKAAKKAAEKAAEEAASKKK